VTLEQVSFGYEFEALVSRRNIFVGITGQAQGAGISSGVVIQRRPATTAPFSS